jgi:phosphohistidine phosphatase SixA
MRPVFVAPALLAVVSLAGRAGGAARIPVLRDRAGRPCEAAQAAADDSAARRLVDALRAGGYVLVFRHAHTERGEGVVDTSLTDRRWQRNLSDQGAEQARAIGRAARALGVPVGDVLASPMFRTRETAEHAFGRADTTGLLGMRNAAPEARALLTAAPPAGTNRVLVTHNAYINRWLGPSGNGQIGEGDAVVVRPLGDAGFDVLGRIRVDEWARLAVR